MICGEIRPPASTGRALRVQAFCPAGKTLMPGEFSSPEQMKETLGGPVRPAARGTAGAHIAELIKTMLEKKASGIDLR
ncbi:hypothetical protein [Flavonifractor plautii]|uniref:hypothetical protein n=1 Tax=Flavonifractor plautii TaxID=292800 RepID=UPI0012EDA249|nr:hypothetical protein [Flavonifractor plautii]MDB7917873.1 hypothetical protein [Flavonifractor plautii]MDB7941779.1 hypothetical protein [Flavonifractor plautii]